MDINIHNSATTGTQDPTTTQINIEVNNLRNLEQNLIIAENHIIQNENQIIQNENQIIQNENQIRGSDSAIAVTIEGVQLQSDNDNPQENEFENEVDSQQSRIILEQALQSAHLCETKGFYIKYGGVPCCPSLTVTPTIMGSGLFSVSPTAWAIKGSSDMGCFCCFMPASWSWQTITLKQGEQEVLNFIYRPQVWNCFTTKEQIVDIYVPQRNERVGWIKYTGSLEDGAVMADCISKSVFLAKGIDSNGTPAIKFTDNFGIPVSVAQASRGIRYRGFTTWTDFEKKYSQLATNMPASAKAVLAVGFLMWVLSYRERNARRRCLIFCGLILFSVLIGLIVGTYGS